MKLTDLSPEWLSPDMFIFKNPTGGDDWLTCKCRVMRHKEQRILVWGYDEGDYDCQPETATKWEGINVVLCEDKCAWNFSGTDFNTLTVTPSVDASKSGNWHGHITNGVIDNA